MNMLRGDHNAITRSPDVLTTILTLSDQVEFAEIEMGKHEHEGDHARAALAAITVLMSRGMELSALLAVPDSQGVHYKQTAEQVSLFLQGLPGRLGEDQPIKPVLDELTLLDATCRELAATSLQEEMVAATHPRLICRRNAASRGKGSFYTSWMNCWTNCVSRWSSLK